MLLPSLTMLHYSEMITLPGHVSTLQPNQGPGINHITAKTVYLLNNRSVVVVERCHDQEWIEHCFPSADAEEWADLCMETLQAS